MSELSHEKLAGEFALLCELTEADRADRLANLLVSDPSLGKELSALFAHADKAPLLDKASVIITQKIMAPGEEWRPGQKVGDFTLGPRLGGGAFGTVFLAQQTSLGRRVALKITPNIGREGQTLAPLDHPHIVRIFSEGRCESGNRLLCLQYIPGVSLEQLLKAFPHGPERTTDLIEYLENSLPGGEPATLLASRLGERAAFSALSLCGVLHTWTEQIASALAYAHDRGVLHLDVKPGNIIIDHYGKAWLSDFNVSLQSLADANELKLNMFGGTDFYMAPEHREAMKTGTPTAFAALSSATDVYSLAKVMDETAEQWTAKRKKWDAVPCRVGTYVDDPKDRPTAAQWAVEARNALKLAEAVQASGTLPLNDWIERDLRSAAVLAVLIPQIIGALVNLVYNGSQIVDWLDDSQREVFKQLCLFYNPVCFALGTYFLFPRMAPVFDSLPRSAADARELRRTALSFPNRAFTIPCLLWVGSFVVFPFGIHFFSSPLPELATYLHFLLSFLFSALVSGTYSYLFSGLVIFRFLYPRLWWGTESISTTAPLELKCVEQRLRIFCWSAGAIPIMGAALFLFLSRPDDGHTLYRWLTLILMSVGVLGFGVAIRIQNYLEKFLQRLTSRS